MVVKEKRVKGEQGESELVELAKNPWEERKTDYYPGDAQVVVASHRQLAAEFDVAQPYFEFTDKGEAFYLDKKLPDGSRLLVGPIGAFTAEQFGATLMEQQSNYVRKGTMGTMFPKEDWTKVRELEAIMIGGFNADRIVVVLEKSSDNGKTTPVASVQAFWGARSTTLNEYFQARKEGQPDVSTLSPFWALDVNSESEELKQFLAQYGELREDEIVTMSRLFTQDKEDLIRLEIESRQIPWLMMAALAQGIELHGQKKQAQMVIYDTDPSIQEKLEEKFGMEVLARNGALTPSKSVMETVLSYHYGNGEEYGGFASSIFLGYKDFAAYQQRAEAFLIEQGITVRDELLAYERAMLDFLATDKILKPEDITPKILREPAELKQAQVEVLSGAKELNRLPFINSVDELVGLRRSLETNQQLRAIVEKKDKVAFKEVSKLLVDQLYEMTTGITKKDIRSLVGEGFLLTDLIFFYQSVIQVTGGASATTEEAWRQALEDTSVYVDEPNTRMVTKLVSEEAFDLLGSSRLLGLIPLEVIKEMQKMKVVVAGASAASESVQLMVRVLGLKNITFADRGVNDGAKQPMINTNGFRDEGQFKVVSLQESLYQQNPFGKYRGVVGRVVLSEADKDSEFDDITLEEFIGDGPDEDTFFLEVIDNPGSKVKFRQWLAEKHPAVNLAWVADVSEAIAGLEDPAAGDPFNRGFSEAELKRMEGDSSLPKEVARYEALRAVVQMLEPQFPPEHRLTFLLFLKNMLPFWPQTPLSAQQSSAALIRQMIIHAQEKVKEDESEVPHTTVVGTNRRLRDVPDFTQYSEVQLNTLQRLMEQIFDLNATYPE